VPSRHDPADALADIIENAGRVGEYLAGMDREAFARDGRLRHAYDRISLNVIWDSVHHDLPGLVAEARQALERLRA